mmetsp:Transcript_14203/g.28783  ORF Transcript_14203/g.28783 Transcript_14203/m.28783 type:complete len:133 (+) Transcript_14203:204-602(+)|eukprot:CAMPEP_0119073496 /NCGR_PEP_ID=MMETSP1178-20130426/66098_1 /TAXON_ID=33656 /ORGANISM="unid sp, Strain CCMP2000" /LENGTH=132 /DNA_ID=CAMNT_0007055583 /DNA_START=204 /DNA_END=602 /DNA_ORIENTATION=+
MVEQLVSQAALVPERRAAFQAAVEEPPDDVEDGQAAVSRDCAQEACKRGMILWKYVDMGEPPTEFWRGRDGTLSAIFDFVGQRPDSSGHRDYRPILQVLERHLNEEPLWRTMVSSQMFNLELSHIITPMHIQ